MPENKMLSSRAQRRPGVSRLFALLFSAVVLTACADSPEDMLGSAKDFLARNDINAASIQLKNAIQKDGSLVEARFLLGKVYLEQGNIPGALRELRRASDAGYPEVEVVPLLSRAMVLSGDFDGVIAAFSERELGDAAAQARLLANVGDAHLAKANVEEARTFYEAAHQQNPQDVMALVGLARAKLFGGDLDGALADADTALALKPDTHEAHALKADVYAAQNQPDEAVAALEAAIKAEPRAPAYHLALISYLLQLERIDDAERRLADMIEVAPRDPSTLYLRAFVDLRRDRVIEARDGIEEVLRLLPGHLPAELLAGSIYLRLNDHVRAQAHLERVLARAPGQPLARRLMAASLLARGETVRARELVEPLLGPGTDDPVTMTLAGQIFLATGDFEQASDYFARVSTANPEDVQALTRLGVARYAAGDVEQALADLENASGLDARLAQPDVALILVYLRNREFDKAAEALEELERKEPDNPQTHNLKGGLMIARQEIDGARLAFERALELDPGFVTALINLARLDLAQGRSDDAKQRFEGMIARDPSNPNPYLLLAQVQAQTGSPPADVRATLERAVAANPTARAPKVAMARHLLENNEATRARTLAQELVAAQPDEPNGLTVLAQAQMSTGERQQAVSTLNRLVRVQTQAPGPLVALADAQRATGDIVGTEQSLRRALALRPDLVAAHQRLIAVLLETQRPADALTVARQVQSLLPNSALGYMLEGDVQATAGNWAQAISPFERALERSPNAGVAVKLHRAQLRADKLDDAAKTAQTLLERQPQDVVMRTYLAEYALAQGRLEEAEGLYRRIIEIQPNNALAFNNLAWVAGRLKQPDAIPLAQRALALAPENPAILDTLGMLQMEQGDHEHGLANLRKAVDTAPNQPALRLNLARSYIEVDRKADAGRELDEVIRLAPEGTAMHSEATRLKGTL
ncbi:XrtA/PEP-CTERM system TPR-repeat protein PrsT [Rhodocyclaceae bacterium SMB388]